MTDCKRFRYPFRTALVSSVVLMVVLFAVGCGDGVRLDSLEVHRIGWDTLRIAPAFERSRAFGGRVVPDSLTVLVSDAGGKTLYTGYASHPRRPLVVPVPDVLLGNEAPFVLDLCGHFERGGTVCEQHRLTASPKRLHADFEVEYPLERDTDRLRYTIRWQREREQTDGAWRPVPMPRRQKARFVVYVRGFPSDAVKMDFSERFGTLDLRKGAGYDDFWMRLHDPLLRGDSVEVVVRLEGRPGAREDSIAALARWVRPASRSERQAEAQWYAQQALSQILDRLETARDGRAEMTVRGWRFDPLQGAYRVDLTVSWAGGFLRMERFGLEASLSVDEATRAGVLHVRHLTPDLQQLWYSRVGSERLALGILPVPCRVGCPE